MRWPGRFLTPCILVPPFAVFEVGLWSWAPSLERLSWALGT
jgi:hypothetical protein